MKHRYASHYIYLSGYGYLRKHGVEVIDGKVVHVFPLIDELENTEWLPGVIALLEVAWVFADDITPVYLHAVPHDAEARFASLCVYHFFPFDFTLMRPVAGTRHKQLL